MLSIYLCGPIEGCTIEEACNWRNHVDMMLGDSFRIIDPMRGKRLIVGQGELILKKDYNPALEYLTKSDAVYQRDMWSVRNADIVLANLDLAHRGGKGTFFEMGVAAALGKLIVAVAQDENVLGHPFVEMSAVKYKDLDAAMSFIVTVG